ncbi:MAG: hypothetical protein WCX84_06050 [Syntrophales bacterium]|jgi:hypothetical protein|nr:hypothetical protein [Syntrophales bacterium]
MTEPRKKKKCKGLALFFILFSFVLPAWADMPVTLLEVDPVAGAYYGWGYNTTTQQFTSPCLQVSSSATYASGDPKQNSFYDFTETTATIAAQTNLSVSAALKVLAGAGTYGASNKTSITGGSETSTYSQTLLASAYRYNVPNLLDLEQVSFKPTALQLLTTPGGKGQFSQQCGDAFVIGIRNGREFFGTASVTKQDMKSWSKFANETGISVEAVGAKADVNVNIGRSMEQAFGNQNITVSTYSTGSNRANPTKASELEGYFKNFFNTSGQEKMVKLIVAPYNMVEGYPWENPLEGNTKEDYVGMMVVALWGLKAAIKDAGFIMTPQTANMFALGLNTNVKAQRKTYIQQQRDMWQKEYDMLLKAAQQCDRQFTEQCRNLAEYYDRHRNLAAQWAAVMPDRYMSDCYQELVLRDFSALKDDLIGKNFGTPFAGDSETAGNRSRVVAELTFRKDQRQLKADLSVAKIEWKRNDWYKMPVEVRTKVGESGWGLQSQAVVFDLDQPARYGVGQENLKYCAFAGEGVQLGTIATPSAQDAAKRFGFGRNKAHGYIDGRSGKNPRGQQHFGNGEGALEFITCEVDRGGKDNNMQCMGLGVRNVRLKLASTQDLEADRWQKPPASPQIPTALTVFSQGKAVNLAQHAVQYAAFTQMVPAKRKMFVSAVEKKKIVDQNSFKRGTLLLPVKQVDMIKKRQKTNLMKIQKPL